MPDAPGAEQAAGGIHHIVRGHARRFVQDYDSVVFGRLFFHALRISQNRGGTVYSLRTVGPIILRCAAQYRAAQCAIRSIIMTHRRGIRSRYYATKHYYARNRKRGLRKIARGITFVPERIATLARLLKEKIVRAIDEIDELNDRTHLLSLNARIEAARAGGESGAAFGVVASAIKNLSEKSSQVANTMASETQSSIVQVAVNQF